jgi:hypothetical protein
MEIIEECADRLVIPRQRRMRVPIPGSMGTSSGRRGSQGGVALPEGSPAGGHVLRIGIPDAVLGTAAAVPAPDGQAHINIRGAPGTQPGAVLAIQGRPAACEQLRAEDAGTAGNRGLSA